MSSPRHFVLPPLDRQGVVMGLNWSQVIAMTVGGAITAMSMASGVPLLVAAIPMAVAGLCCYGRVGGVPVLEWVRPLTHAARTRRTPTWETDTVWDGTIGELPEALRDLAVTEEAWSGLDRMAVVWDNDARTAAALLRVAGTDFALLDVEEQNRLLEGWGLVLAAHAREGSTLARICWSETATRSSQDDHTDWVERQGSDVRDEDRRAYRALVAAAAPSTTRHDVICTVVTSAHRLRRGANTARGESQRLIDALARNVTATMRGLNDAGLRDVEVLSGPGVAEVMQRALDPATALSVAPKGGGLADRLGFGSQSRSGPWNTEWRWPSFSTDGAVHRSYWVADWPRHAVAGSWMSDLLGRSEVSRRVTVIFEPVAPSAAHRRIEREIARLDTDALTREDHGKRITASWRRTRDAVSDREEELVAGFAEVEYAGIVTVSAISLTALEEASETFEANALQSGLTVAALEGQHDLGFAAGLPLGIGLSNNHWWKK